MPSLVYPLSCGFVLGIALQTALVPPASLASLDTYVDEAVAVHGVLAAPPDVRETATRLTLDTATTRILAVVPAGVEVHVGDFLTVSGPLTRPEPFDTEGGHVFRYDYFLAKEGIFGIVNPASVAMHGTSTRIDLQAARVLQYVHDEFIDAVQKALPQPESSLAAGIIAGGKQGLGKELLDAFTVAGMLQIVVLSGYNVMIVANGILRLVSFLPRRLAFICAVCGLSAFILAAGAGSAALRAGLMAVIALWARTFGKTHHALIALCLSLILLLLWNPLLLLYDPGLQLSFMATLGLIVGTPRLEPYLAWIPSLALREIIGTTIAAQIAVLPLLLYQSGNLSFVSFFTNVLAAPAIPWAMATSAVAAGLTYVLPLPAVQVMALPAYVLLGYILWIARFFAALPYAQVIVPGFAPWIMFLAYGGLAWGICKNATQQRPSAAAECSS